MRGREGDRRERENERKWDGPLTHISGCAPAAPHLYNTPLSIPAYIRERHFQHNKAISCLKRTQRTVETYLQSCDKTCTF